MTVARGLFRLSIAALLVWEGYRPAREPSQESRGPSRLWLRPAALAGTHGAVQGVGLMRGCARATAAQCAEGTYQDKLRRLWSRYIPILPR